MLHSKYFIFALLLFFICFFHIILFIVWKVSEAKILDLYFRRIFVFIVPIGFLICVLMVGDSVLAKREYGITMENQIKQQFAAINEKKYDSIILGNSRLYRGINPELIDSDCYNFAFDNDSFLECYYKLKFMESIEKLPERVILGVDYFEFSFVSAGMQATYDAYFEKEYDDILANCSSLSFGGERSNIDIQINKKLNILFISNYYNAISYLYNRYIKKDKRVSFVSEHGQYCIYPQPKAKAGDFLTRSSEIMNEQKTAYENIIIFCKERNIKLIQLMLPLRDIELNCYTAETKEMFDNFFSKNDSAKYLNYAIAADFQISDFMDDTHLNLIGADKFTKQLNADLINLSFYEE